VSLVVPWSQNGSLSTTAKLSVCKLVFVPTLTYGREQGRYFPRNGIIWRRRLALSSSRDNAYLLDYFYARAVIYRTLYFPSCSDVFQEGNCFLKGGNKRFAFVLR